MRLLIVVVVAAVLLLGVTEAGRRRERRRHRGLHRDGKKAETSKGWKTFLDRLRESFGSRRYGVGLGGDKFNLDFNFGWNQNPKEWWKGPNVCKSVSKEEANATGVDLGAPARHFSYYSHICDESETAYRCKTTSKVLNKRDITVEVYECCHGYTREKGEFGCPSTLDLKDLVATARKLGLTEFLRATDSVSLTEELRQANFTLFAPENGAFKKIGSMLPDLSDIMPKDQANQVVMVSKPATKLVLADMQSLLLGHMVVGYHGSTSLQDEQLVDTGSPYKAKIRINYYEGPEKLMTANCVRVTSSDNRATNGVIHTVDSMLQPVTDSIVDFVSKSPQHGYLKTALARANLVQTFREDGQFTLFAPTDAAFKKIAPETLNKLLKGDRECLLKVLKNHVLPNVICSTVIQGDAKSHNLLNTYLNLTRDDADKIFVHNSQIVQNDIMATNGVIHVIDDVLVPDEALRVTDLMQKEGATEAYDLLKKGRVLEEILNLSNITFFVPSNKAFQSIPEASLQRIKTDPDYLKSVIKYHIVPEPVSTRRVYNNILLDTSDGDKKIRINEYSVFPYGDHLTQTAQCAPVSKRDLKSCNGILTIIDKVMLPPPGNVVDVLALDPRFTTLIELLKKSGVADALQEKGPFTIFAPTNDAFMSLGSRTLKMLEKRPEELRRIIESHVASDALCCAGIFESGWYGSPRLRTLARQVFRLDRQGEVIKVGPARVTECDLTGSNGIVHVIDRVLVEGEMEGIQGQLLGRRGWGGRRHGSRGHGGRNLWDLFG